MSTDAACAEFFDSGDNVVWDQFILFGDSITQSSGDQERGFAFAPAIQEDYIRRLDVLNRGFSGYNSEQALHILPLFYPPVAKDRVRLMTVFFGANDAVLAGCNQHVPLDRYKTCLKDIINHPVVRAHNTKILLLTPPPVNEHQLEPDEVTNDPSEARRVAANTKLYADACRDVGISLSVPVVDIWAAFMDAAGWIEGQPLAGSKDAPRNEKLEKLLSDGLHFNPEGYRIMYDEVIKGIRTNYPDQAPERLPINFPPWQQAPR